MIEHILITSAGIVLLAVAWCLCYFTSLYIVARILDHFDRLACDTYFFAAGVLFLLWSVPVVVTIFETGW